MAVTRTNLVWPFKQDQWEGWWGPLEGLFRVADRRQHTIAVGCCAASDLYAPEVIQEEPGDCISLRVPVSVAKDRLAALGSNRRDADARIQGAVQRASSSARIIWDDLCSSMMSASSPLTVRGQVAPFELGDELEFILKPLDVFAVLLDWAPDDSEVVITSLRGEVYDLLTALGDDFFANYDPLEWSVHSRGVATTVVLTEGVFDQEVIERVVREAYPHLQDYIRFIDADIPVERGARALVHFVRALMAAGVREPNFVAVFDNDREGVLNANKLAGLSLVTGYRVCTLPTRSNFKSVPVELPSEIAPADVNGWGAPIELYLAEDLAIEAPTLTLARIADSYQGVLKQPDKARIQEAYRNSTTSPGPAARSIINAILHGGADLQPPDTVSSRPPRQPFSYES